ncbi:MAG: carbonic anhydrase/acetyltransferase-like protein (isoleucine patch superfamily) [Candidatus Paceibacteria bacterium]|jgi:carbonic anhydrase/acetyltransferase-like protein (isoleucine patch superfamily)
MTQFPMRGRMLAQEGGGFVADNAVLTGEIDLGDESSIWFGCVLRGDDAPITIGARTNIQDQTMVHADPGVPNVIGADVTVGHRCVLHGALVEDHCLIGMGAILLAGSRIGAGSIIGAGTVIKEGFVVPPRSLVVGLPGRIVRKVTDEQYEAIAQSVLGYMHASREYADK